ncbi:MAG TPA: PKD domain-containing protein [Rhodanobacteraceae bacterium]|nr:PKD domain-containing protein [Rhodanobacteraceae bacterium]
MSNPTVIVINQNADGSYDIPAITLRPAAAAPPAQPDPVPAFSMTADGLTVNITDQSVLNGGQESWDFGDGTASVVQGDQAHSYAQAGTYTVGLTIAGATGGTWPLSQTVTVADPVVPPPPPSGDPAIGAPVSTQAEWDAINPKDA